MLTLTSDRNSLWSSHQSHYLLDTSWQIMGQIVWRVSFLLGWQNKNDNDSWLAVKGIKFRMSFDFWSDLKIRNNLLLQYNYWKWAKRNKQMISKAVIDEAAHMTDTIWSDADNSSSPSWIMFMEWKSEVWPFALALWKLHPGSKRLENLTHRSDRKFRVHDVEIVPHQSPIQVSLSGPL